MAGRQAEIGEAKAVQVRTFCTGIKSTKVESVLPCASFIGKQGPIYISLLFIKYYSGMKKRDTRL